MSERRKTHNGRDTSGNFKVKQADVDDLETNPDGAVAVKTRHVDDTERRQAAARRHRLATLRRGRDDHPRRPARYRSNAHLDARCRTGDRGEVRRRGADHGNRHASAAPAASTNEGRRPSEAHVPRISCR